MSTPSWVELAGRNAAAETVYVSGSMRTSAKEGNETPGPVFDFWHGPHDRWRIEREGDVVYIQGAGEKPLVRIDGEMRRLGEDIRVVNLGAHFSPVDLLGGDSLLRRMSQKMSVVAPPARVDRAGRAAWRTTLLSRSDDSIEITFDDITGIIVGVGNPERGDLFEVYDVSEHDDLPADLFVWSGPVVEAESRDRGRRGGRPGDPRERREQTFEVMAATVAALDRPQDVLEAIAGADNGAAARAAIIELLGVSEPGAEAVAAMQLSQFRSDVARMARAGLIELQRTSPPA
ncbi:hypothetical protein [Williamsia muralis]|uniref:Uncharacterized protein n=1 Tax=Williamsia marianensis TaxID=85044 RepID=A0A2G3PLN5_WILMA|nr:hypothetical protein [Williamsia marianensis]PHV66737.1 hypothetical protein CSW57_10690 [Williamsia marianensis]